MRLNSPIDTLSQKIPALGELLDKLIHPGRHSGENDDPGRPFTPPPSRPSKAERDDKDDDGPTFPMDPAIA